MLAFGGHNHALGIAPFEFYRSADVLGWSRIMVRDLDREFYQQGLAPKLRRPSDVWVYLAQQIPDARLVIVGASVGGWMALNAAGILMPDRVVVLNPLTSLDPHHLAEMNDDRWRSKLDRWHERPSLWSALWDTAIPADRACCPIEIHHCANDRQDAAHAEHLAALANVTIHRHPCTGHATGAYLKQAGTLPAIIRGNTT
jgi:hypothetical protein